MSRPKIVPITHTPVDVDEAIMRADYILKLKRIRDELVELRQDDYLYSPNLSVEDTHRIEEHTADAQKSLEAAICYVRPAIPKWEDEA